MDAKLLTESGLKAILSKHKVKDNGLQKALAAYEKLDEDEDDKDKDEDDEDGEEEEGEYGDRLLTAFKKLKTLNGEPMDFIVCDARPLPAIMVARRVTSKHRKELTELTDGSKKFHRGT